MYLYIYIHTHTYTHTHIRKIASLHAHTHTRTHAQSHNHTTTHTHTHTYMWECKTNLVAYHLNPRFPSSQRAANGLTTRNRGFWLAEFRKRGFRQFRQFRCSGFRKLAPTYMPVTKARNPQHLNCSILHSLHEPSTLP